MKTRANVNQITSTFESNGVVREDLKGDVDVEKGLRLGGDKRAAL